MNQSPRLKVSASNKGTLARIKEPPGVSPWPICGNRDYFLNKPIRCRLTHPQTFDYSHNQSRRFTLAGQSFAKFLSPFCRVL